MKFLISIALSFFSLLPGFAQSELTVMEFHPSPEIVDALTEPPLTGQYYQFFVTPNIWGPPYVDCHTAQEAAEFLNNCQQGNTCETVIHEDMGSCKKCSSWDLTLVNYNGSDVCMANPACEPSYQYGTYDGTDGCIKCPANYAFWGGLCRWSGSGPAPPAPKPTPPANLKASNGRSTDSIIIKWNKSSSSLTDYYDLERAAGIAGDERFTWWRVARIRETENSYSDRSVKVATWYSYRVRACNSSDGQCSSYSNIDRGYKALKAPEPVRVVLTPKYNPERVQVLWPSVPGAESYLILWARSKNRYFYRSGFDYTDSGFLTHNREGEFYFVFKIVEDETDIVIERGYPRFISLKDNNRAIFVIAVKEVDGRSMFGYPAVWNPPSSLPKSGILQLLLRGK